MRAGGNLLVTAAMTLVGIGVLAVMTYPLWPSPRPRPVMSAAIDRRWLPPEPPPLPKTDRLASAAPWAPEEPAPIKQAVEGKAKDPGELVHEYRRTAQRDVCARHHLRKVYVHHHRGWRCR